MKQRIKVVGIIRREDEILLLKKNDGRMEKATTWGLPSGKIRYGEQPEEAMARIVYECTGAVIENARLKDAITFMSRSRTEQMSSLYIIYDIFLRTGERIVAGDQYTAYKFIRFDDPQTVASVRLEEDSQLILEIELGKTAKPIFDGVTANMLGNNLSTATIYVDGGSRGNPGPSGVGYHIVGSDGVTVKSGGAFIGFATSRVAEYYALKEGCEQAIQLGIKSARFVSDSLMLINQMNGLYKIKNRDVVPIYNDIRGLLTKFDTVAFAHVKRIDNVEADRQVNIAINRHFDLNEDGSGGGFAITEHDEG